MDLIELDERFSEVKRLCDERESSPEPPYWIYGDNEAESWCYDCLRKELPSGKIGEDYGGGYSCEDDGSEVCCKCGNLLQYELTNYGVDYELEHFEECSPDLNNADVCYMLGRIAYGIVSDDIERIQRVVAVVEKAGQ